jgi:hypothetical protein
MQFFFGFLVVGPVTLKKPERGRFRFFLIEPPNRFVFKTMLVDSPQRMMRTTIPHGCTYACNVQDLTQRQSSHRTNLTSHGPTIRLAWSSRRETQMAASPPCLRARPLFLVTHRTEQPFDVTRFNCNGFLQKRALEHNDDSHRRRRLNVLTRTSMTPWHTLSDDDLDKTPGIRPWHHLSYQRSSSSTAFCRQLLAVPSTSLRQLVPNQTTWILNSKQRQTK